jgi:hypothetical protein
MGWRWCILYLYSDRRSVNWHSLLMHSILYILNFHPTIDITIAIHPSPYAALRATSSRGAVIGSTTPCKTGFAKTGIRRLGKRFGSRVWRADPTVCSCIRVPDGVTLVVVVEEEDCVIGIEGGTGDWTTLRAGLCESGGNGRKMRMGI